MALVPGVVVITGGASGMGQASSKVFVTEGCTGVALVDINSDNLEITKAMLTDHAKSVSSKAIIKTYTCDVSNETQVSQTYFQIKTDFTRIDYAINCAGIMILAPGSADLQTDLFDRQMNVNTRGVFLCSRAALQVMKNQSLDIEAYPDAKIPESRAQRGAIVSIASSLAFVNIPEAPAYCASKAAVLSLTRSNAIDYVGDRIRVNAVAPGPVDTPFVAPTPEIREHLRSLAHSVTPMKRFADAEEIADVIVFLASNKASFVTGAGWVIDGGHTIQ